MAELKTKGATALGDEGLKQLIVDKTILVRTTISGRRFEILHGSDRQRLITAADENTPDMKVMGELSHGRPLQYEIRDGRYIVKVAGTPFKVTVFKMGNEYVGERSNEFG